MKKWLLSGCLLTLMACGQMPQERIDTLKESIAEFEENGAGIEMPDEFRRLKDSFARVLQAAEAEQKKVLSDYSAVEEHLGRMEKQLDNMANVIYERSENFRKRTANSRGKPAWGCSCTGACPKTKPGVFPSR